MPLQTLSLGVYRTPELLSQSTAEQYTYPFVYDD